MSNIVLVLLSWLILNDQLILVVTYFHVSHVLVLFVKAECIVTRLLYAQ
jgi:hypothetical protein